MYVCVRKHTFFSIGVFGIKTDNDDKNDSCWFEYDVKRYETEPIINLRFIANTRCKYERPTRWEYRSGIAHCVLFLICTFENDLCEIAKNIATINEYIEKTCRFPNDINEAFNFICDGQFDPNAINKVAKTKFLYRNGKILC